MSYLNVAASASCRRPSGILLQTQQQGFIQNHLQFHSRQLYSFHKHLLHNHHLGIILLTFGDQPPELQNLHTSDTRGRISGIWHWDSNLSQWELSLDDLNTLQNPHRQFWVGSMRQAVVKLELGQLPLPSQPADHQCIGKVAHSARVFCLSLPRHRPLCPACPAFQPNQPLSPPYHPSLSLPNKLPQCSIYM